MKKVTISFCALIFLFSCLFPVHAEGAPGIANSAAAILYEPVTGKVLYSNNINKKLPIASTTKIMTSLLAVEAGDIDTNFQVDPDAVRVEGTSVGLLGGDIVTLRTLVYCMLLESGNDAANAAAFEIAGSQEDFAKLMNERAEQIGMKDTNFVTPSGLDAEGHYSTAYDMALLAATSLQNPVFFSICSQEYAVVEFGNPQVRRKLYNHNRLLQLYEGTIGIKTGFTKKAGRCLVSAAVKDGITLICVTLNTADDWNVHKKLYNYGFSKVSMTSLPDPGSINVPITGGTAGIVTVKPEGTLAAPLEEGELGRVTYTVEIPRFLYAPVAKGQQVGTVKYLLDGKVIKELPMVIGQDVEKTRIQLGFFTWLIDLIANLFR